MSIDKITPIRTDVIDTHSKPVTIEMLIDLMDAWRETKKKLNEKIPDRIWDQVFTLIESMPESRVLKVLGISPGQYNSKKLERDIPLYSSVNDTKSAASSFDQVTSSKADPHRAGTELNDKGFTKPSLVRKSISNEDVDFCEVKSPAYPLVGKPATAFATTTCVVELVRPDGLLMKIHICTDRFHELLHAFYNGDGGVKC